MNYRLNQAARQGRQTEDEQLLLPKSKEDSFVNDDTWRVLRITSEFVAGFDALADMGTAVTIFGSARTKPDQPQYKQAVEVARLLGEAGFSIITGGGPGIMQAGNEGAKQAGVPSVGLNIELPFEQHINEYVDVAIDFRYFFVRKTMLVKYAQGFVIFPGGFGTMDELFEALTLVQTGKVRDFPIVLFGSSYWGGLMNWLEDTMLAEGKISPEDLKLPLVTDSPEEVRDVVVSCVKAELTEWRQEIEESAREVTRSIYANA